MGYIAFNDAKDLLNEIAHIDLNEYSESEEEKMKRLRAKAISSLINQATEIFLEHESEILAGTFDKELLSQSTYAAHLGVIEQETRSLVFNHRDVVSIQVAGYEVLGNLFAEFVNAILHSSKKGDLILKMLPKEYHPASNESSYDKILKVTDYISGMTDSYATTLFQQLKGISLI